MEPKLGTNTISITGSASSTCSNPNDYDSVVEFDRPENLGPEPFGIWVVTMITIHPAEVEGEEGREGKPKVVRAAVSLSSRCICHGSQLDVTTCRRRGRAKICHRVSSRLDSFPRLDKDAVEKTGVSRQQTTGSVSPPMAAGAKEEIEVSSPPHPMYRPALVNAQTLLDSILLL